MRRIAAWISLLSLLTALCGGVLALTPAVACSDSYLNSPFYSSLIQIDASSGNQRDLFYKIAISQVGYKESNSQYDLSGTKDGSQNWTEYGRFMGTNGPDAAWCAIFVSWCAAQAGIDNTVIKRGVYAGPMCSTVHSSDEVLNGTYVPRGGDIVTFLWDTAGRKITYSHVGIVTSVVRNANGKSYVLKTIEGNVNNAVTEKSRTIRRGGKFAGGKVVNFGVPNFAGSSQNPIGSNVPSLTISGQTLPTTLDSGSNFGIRGIVKTDVGNITKVHGEILNSLGTVVQSGDAFPNQATHDLRYSINNNLIFDDLPVGNYTYRVTATAVNGDKTQTSTLIETTFTIRQATTQNTVEPETPVLSIQDQTVPSVQTVGSNFGVRGIVKTDVGSITKVHGEILDSSGTVVQSGDAFPNQATHDLRYSINNNLIFDDLPVGDYTYRVIATAANGTKTVTTTLIDSPFTVVSLWTQDQTPTLHIEGQNAPTSLSIGQNFGIRGTVRTSCGSITRVVGEIINSQGEVVQMGNYSPYTSSHDLRYSINNDLIFNNLPVGSYSYKVTATAVNGSKSATAILIESSFTVN